MYLAIVMGGEHLIAQCARDILDLPMLGLDMPLHHSDIWTPEITSATNEAVPRDGLNVVRKVCKARRKNVEVFFSLDNTLSDSERSCEEVSKGMDEILPLHQEDNLMIAKRETVENCGQTILRSNASTASEKLEVVWKIGYIPGCVFTL